MFALLFSAVILFAITCITISTLGSRSGNAANDRLDS